MCLRVPGALGDRRAQGTDTPSQMSASGARTGLVQITTPTPAGRAGRWSHRQLRASQGGEGTPSNEAVNWGHLVSSLPLPLEEGPAGACGGPGPGRGRAGTSGHGEPHVCFHC